MNAGLREKEERPSNRHLSATSKFASWLVYGAAMLEPVPQHRTSSW